MTHEEAGYERSDAMARIEICRRDDGFYSYEEQWAETEELPDISDEVYHFWMPTYQSGLFLSHADALEDARKRYSWIETN